jgi:hypothetical protein
MSLSKNKKLLNNMSLSKNIKLVNNIKNKIPLVNNIKNKIPLVNNIKNKMLLVKQKKKFVEINNNKSKTQNILIDKTDYNYYKIFKWNSNIGIYNCTNNYNNILVHTGSRIKNEWQNALAFKYINNNLHIIMNSNSYYIEGEHSKEANRLYKMYDNMIKNYLDVNQKTKIVNNEYYNDTSYFYMIDAFAFSNSGHNLSDYLNKVEYILKNNITNIVIYEGYKETNNYKLINLLLPNCTFHELKMDTIYNFTNIIIIPPVIYNINLHDNIICRLRENITINYSDIYNDCKFKNIILMKTHLNKNVMLPSSQFDCPDFINILENNGFINIIPENIDIFKLCIYLLFANKIVFSTGSVLYTNKIFFNKSAKLIYMKMNKKDKDACCGEELINKKNIEIIFTDKKITNNLKSVLHEILK